MGQCETVADVGEIVEGDELEGNHLAALLTWVDRGYPPLLRINPAHVTSACRPDIIAWATEAVRQRARLAVYRVSDLNRDGAR